MESKKQTTPPPPATTPPLFAAAARSDESITAANARIADLRLLRGLCVHVLEPIVAKAQAVLRDASLHLAALDDDDDEEARENTPDADALAMLPGFFIIIIFLLQRGQVERGVAEDRLGLGHDGLEDVDAEAAEETEVRDAGVGGGDAAVVARRCKQRRGRRGRWGCCLFL